MKHLLYELPVFIMASKATACSPTISAKTVGK